MRVRAVAPVAVVDRHDGAAAERCDQHTNHESDLHSQSSQDGQSCPLAIFHGFLDMRNQQPPIIVCAVLLLDKGHDICGRQRLSNPGMEWLLLNGSNEC